jgi:hypothetical protein
MIEQAAPVAKRGGETARHLSLKALAVEWAIKEGLVLAAPEVAFPHRRFRVDVAACAPARKTPSRRPVTHISCVLKSAAIFECKQARSDLIRDNKQRAKLRERLQLLEARRIRMESLLQLHLPHLANGESLFPDFDSYRLREHNHAGYKKLMREIRIAKRGVIDCTKFDRLLSYGLANIHYLVTEESLITAQEVPVGWGFLIRRGDGLELVAKPVWQAIGVEQQLIFLQRIATKKTGTAD